MPHHAVPSARFINRDLGEPYDTLLGGEEAHRLLATAFADGMPDCGISWDDRYAAADRLPLPQKARLLLDPTGRAIPPTTGQTGEARQRASEAGGLAERVVRMAQQLGVD
ncbi:hypothetical protein ACFVQ4_25075 [Streptomyces laurentii]|uniref:hypothetical protein n=1 Tax=Streptomyces laurentii TaxID=39478 RepID=UPI0036C196FF